MNIVGLRFTKIGKLYHFDLGNVRGVELGGHVIVETSRGRQIGEVIQFLKDPPPPPEGSWKRIERRATPADLLSRQQWQSRQVEAMINCRARAAELRLDGVKIVAAEYSYDGSRLTFLFSTETEEKPDLKSLRRDMGRLYPTQQVEMRQIAPGWQIGRDGCLWSGDTLLLEVPNRV
jgi:cell fate regulator YaaT (PSP1 superfamily)